MKKILILLTLSSAFLLGATQEYNGENKKDLDTTIVVSLKEDSRYSKKEIQDYFFNSLTYSIGYDYRKIDSFTSLTNVVTLKINSNDLGIIQNLPLVSSAYKEIEYEAYDYSIDDPDYSVYTFSKVPSNYSALDMNKGDSGNGENTLVAILDTSLNYNHEAFKSIDSTSIRYSKDDISKIVSSSSNFHATNYKYINDKVPFSYDYAGNSRTNAVEDDDVLSTQDHGSHVASIVSGNGAYKGIAPSSQIAFFKVFNNFASGCTTSIYLKALEDAYALNVDAINMSFGSTLLYNDTEEDIAVNELINKMAEEGIECFIASGNDGKNAFNSSTYKFSSLENTETGSSGSLGTLNNGNSIGSYSTSYALNNISCSDGTYNYKINDRIISRTGLSSVDGSKTLYDVETTRLSKEYRFNSFIGKGKIEIIEIPNYGSKDDYSDLNVKGKIALVKRGDIAFYEKIDAAMKAGASGLIIYSQGNEDNETPYFGYEIQESDMDKDLPTFTQNDKTYYDYRKINIPVSVMAHSDASNLLKELKNEGSTYLTFYQDEISSFSSQGGDPTLSLKPDFIAPGSNIFGAATYGYTLNNNQVTTSNKGYYTDKYIFKNGTSMATPNAMGAYISSLSTSLNNESDRKEIRLNTINKLRSNTTILKDSDGVYYSPRIQGAGLVNITKSNESSSYLTYNSKSKVELKNNDDIKEGKIIFDIDFNSSLKESKEYEIKVTIMSPLIKEIEGVGKVQSSNDKVLETYSFKQNLKDGDKISINRSLNSSSKEYLKEFSNGTYLEGYVEIISNDESLSIPFLGYYGVNYDLIKPFEDFDFEKSDKSDSITYESDLLEEYISNKLNIDQEDVILDSSMLIGEDTYSGFSTYYSYYMNNVNDYTVPFSSKAYNYSDVKAYKSPYSSKYQIYLEDISYKRGLTIQLFMLKSMKEGRILIDGEIQDEETCYFVDSKNAYKDVTKQLFKSYGMLQSSIFTDSLTHKTIGYISFVEDGDIRYQRIDNGYHKLTLEFTTFNNTTLLYEYDLYINMDYNPTPSIYDVSYKNNILTITLKDVENISKICIDEEESDLKVEIKDNTFIFNYDTSSLSKDTYFEFYNTYNNKVSFKYFVNSEVVYVYGESVTKDTGVEITEEESMIGDKYYTRKEYYFSNLSKDSEWGKLNFGIKNNILDASFYEGNIGESNLISVTSDDEVNKVSSYYRKFIKLSNERDISDNSSSLNFTFIYIIIGIILGIAFIFIAIFIGLKFYFNKNK